jgi:CRISPR/Cas system CSM-associated protein Csm3 (group 7 of RAMP superfamily)
MRWNSLNWALKNIIQPENIMVHPLQIELVFQLNSGVHITGELAKLWTDKALVVDWRDGSKPVVPATTLKGWLRESAERILRGLGQTVCDGSRADSICDQQFCLVCQVFGAPRQRSWLYFSDAVLDDSATEVRMNVSLSRRRKTAYEERLFSTEVAWSRQIRAQIGGWFDSRSRSLQAAAILVLAAQTGYAIGAARSRGLGWVQLHQWSVKVDEQPVPKEDIYQQIQHLGKPLEVAS